MSAGKGRSVNDLNFETAQRWTMLGLSKLPQQILIRVSALLILTLVASACTFDLEPGHQARVDVHNDCGVPVLVVVGDERDSFDPNEPADGMYEIPVDETVTLPESLVPPVGPYLYLWAAAPSARETGRPVRLETGSLMTSVDSSGLTHYKIEVVAGSCP